MCYALTSFLYMSNLNIIFYILQNLIKHYVYNLKSNKYFKE